MSRSARYRLHDLVRLLVFSTFLIFLALQFLSAPVVHAASIIRVSPTGATSSCGGTWAAACSLQTALTNAASGDEIWVGAGVYKPTTTTTDRTATFTLKNGVAIYGGFAMTETLRTQRDYMKNQSILSGDIDNNDSQTPLIYDMTTVTGNTTNSYHVVSSAVGVNATLDGIGITAGYAPSGPNSGGGLYNSGNLTLTNVAFHGNYAYYGGGGMYNATGNPVLTSVAFLTNTGYTNGGGMYVNSGSPTLSNVLFQGNNAPTNLGGGFNSAGGTSQLSNVAFYNNRASFGAAIGVFPGGTTTVNNSVIQGNQANYDGGGIDNTGGSLNLNNVLISGNYGSPAAALEFYNHGGSTGVTTLNHVTTTGNRASSSGGYYGAVFLGTYYATATMTIKNSIFWNDSPYGEFTIETGAAVTLADSVAGGGCPANVTCSNVLNSDPQFVTPVNPSSAPTTNGNLLLSPTSPAIDMGNSATCLSTDLRGEARDDLRCDIGAYERKFSDGNWVAETPSTATMRTYGPARVGVQDLGTTHPGVITATKVTNWTGGTPSGTLGAWWELSAPTDTGLNLTMKLCYSTAEIGNFTENTSARFWRYSGGTWTSVGSTPAFSGTSPNRCAQISGVTDLSRWTLATGNPGNNPTAVTLSSFKANAPLDLGAWLRGFLGR